MCGIVGFSGNQSAREKTGSGKKVRDILIEGLYSLEYRGYDSAGIAVTDEKGEITVVKSSGRVEELDRMTEKNEKMNSGICGIAHTRWATHGRPTTANAHPHSSEKVTIVHNGIIDNYVDLKKMLEGDGYVFLSETDTETVCHLIDREYKKTSDPIEAIRNSLDYLKGSYALAIMFNDRPGEIWATRKDNPLIVAKGEDGCYLASDIPALLHHTRDIYRPADGEILCLNGEKVVLFDREGREKNFEFSHIDWNVNAADKEGFPHFMLKEIFEEPDAVRRCVSHRIGEDGLPDFSVDGIPDEMWNSFDSIQIISCGSATHAGYVGRYLIEALADVPVTVNTASEYRYMPPAFVGKTLAIAISQSGETADTLAALRKAKEKGCTSAGIINVFGSAIARESDYVMYTNAGPEIAVATTKGYTTQVAVLSLIACKLALARGRMTKEEALSYCDSLKNAVPDAIGNITERRDEIKKAAMRISKQHDVYFIGRGPDYYAGIECSLKLKEISYIHSEAYAAGELKHGTLALIEKDTPVIALCTDGMYYEKMNGNIREVRARDCYLLLVHSPSFPHPEEFSDDRFELPEVPAVFTPIVSVVFAQLLAYETAVMLGCDVDHPRNLAKSVTVE